MIDAFQSFLHEPESVWVVGICAIALLALLTYFIAAFVVTAHKCDRLALVCAEQHEPPKYKVVLYQSSKGAWLSKIVDLKTNRVLFLNAFQGKGKHAKTREEAFERAYPVLRKGVEVETEYP